MSSSNQITQKKRNRERAQKEKRQEKDDKRGSRKEQKAYNKELREKGIDPDLMDIVPGPQKPLF